MAICVEIHVLTAGTSSNALKIDGVAPSAGVNAFLPSLTQTETNCTGYLLQTAAELSSQNAIISNLTLDLIGIDPIKIAYVFFLGNGCCFKYVGIRLCRWRIRQSDTKDLAQFRANLAGGFP